MGTQSVSLRAEQGAEDMQPAPESTSRSAGKKAASAFRTISEVAEELDVQQHVLRFWETKFSQIRPLKRGGGRRYYRPEDVALLKTIHNLLYTEGYTIKGVQKLLKDQGKNKVIQATAKAVAPAQPQAAPAAGGSQQGTLLTARHRKDLESMLADLRDLRKMAAGED